MSHYALIENGIVQQVIVADADHIANLTNSKDWVQTSYNTYSGVHRTGKTPLRKNYAGIGYSYDKVRDAFIPAKAFSSWILNEDSCQWEAPIPRPSDGKHYNWDESTTNWIEAD